MGQSAFFNELYGRALRVDDALPNTQSKKMSLLWMSYLADSSQPSVLYDLANLNLRENDNEKAQELLARSFETSEHDFHTGLLLMSLSGYLSDWDKVEEVKEVLLDLRPGDPSVLQQLMQIYQMGGKDSLAIDIVKQLRESNGSDPRYTFQLASMLTESERYEEAEEILRSYLTEHPGDKFGTQMLSSFLIEREQYEEAFSLAGSLYKRFPEDPGTVQLLAGAASARGDYSKVKDVLRSYATGSGAIPEVTLQLLQSVRQTAKDGTALERSLLPFLKELQSKHPSEEAFQSLLMQHYITVGDTLGLRKEVRELVSRSANAREAYDVLLNKYIKENNNDSVAYVVRKGLVAFPEDPTFLLYDIVGDLLKNPEGSEEVMAKIDHALSIIPEDSRQALEISVAKADLLEQTGKWEEARPLYEKAASRGHIGASNNLAYFLTLYGKEEDLAYAEKLASDVIKAEPDNATYLDTYAWILYKRGAYGLAKMYMKKAIDKAPDPDKTYWEHYARILTSSGDLEEAKAAWRKALELGLEAKTAEEGILKILDLEKKKQ